MRLSLVALLVSTAMLAGAGAALAGGAAVPKISFAAAEDGWYSVSVQPAARVRVTLQAGSDCNFLNQVCKSYDTIDSKLVAKGTVGHISWIKASFWGQPPSRRGDTLYPGRYRMVFQVPGIKASVVTTTWNLQYGD